MSKQKTNVIRAKTTTSLFGVINKSTANKLKPRNPTGESLSVNVKLHPNNLIGSGRIIWGTSTFKYISLVISFLLGSIDDNIFKK